MNETYVINSMYDYFKLSGKTAIVTGAGNGIGKGIAEMMASLGVNVVACDIEMDSVEKVAQEITEKGGIIRAVHCDVRNMDDVDKTIQTALTEFGGLDILVNNAAGCGGGVKLDDMTDQEWDRLINLNLTCVYKFTMRVLPYMRKQHSGKIINISSGAAIIGEGSDPHYSAAKGGLISLGKELAIELSKDGICINTVAPGVIRTRMLLPWESVEANNILVGRLGEPWDVAATVVFFASAASDFFTGQVLCPNGGAWMY